MTHRRPPAGPRRVARARRARAVRVEARAKLNLGLAVGPRRSDGYHQVATVYQSISLADSLTIERRREGFRLEVRHADPFGSGTRGRSDAPAGRDGRARRGSREPWRTPTGSDNLVLRAAALFRRRFGLEEGASFRLLKRIPVGAGLGGGSADAAATLAGLARLHGIRLGAAQRLELAAALGSDVPFACLGGTALGLGRGEALRRLALARPFRALVAVPRWRVATALAYRRIDRGKYGLTAWDAKLRFAQGLGRDEVTAERALALGNTFELALGSRRAGFRSLCERLRAAGLQTPRMTGSGSAVFGILGSGVPVQSVMRRFAGRERLYAVGSTRSGLKVVTFL